MKTIYLDIAGQIITIHPLYSYMEEYCKGYTTEESIKGREIIDATVTYEDILFEREQGHENMRVSNAYLETLAVYRKISEALIQKDILLLHASVVEKDGKGYAFTAKSGTGKSTHSDLWVRMLHGRIINDDKPLILLRKGKVYACGTPWNGKHKRGCNETCELSSICLLERGEKNTITQITKSEMYPYLLQQIYRPRDPALFLKEIALIQELLENIKVYRLKCNMDISAALVAWEGMK